MTTALALLRQFWAQAALAVALLVAWHFHARAAANADALRTQAAQFAQAQADATRTAQEALHHQEALYRAKAQEADHAHDVALADARSAAYRYIADHRVRTAPVAGGAGGTVAPSSSGDPGVRAGLPADGVMVSERDVQACTDVTSYALSLREWALGL